MNDIVRLIPATKLLEYSGIVFNSLRNSTDYAIGIQRNEYSEKVETVIITLNAFNGAIVVHFDTANLIASYYSSDTISNAQACYAILGSFIWAATFQKTGLSKLVEKEVDLEQFSKALIFELKQKDGFGGMKFVSDSSGEPVRISKLLLKTGLLVPDEVIVDECRMFKAMLGDRMRDELYEKDSRPAAMPAVIPTEPSRAYTQEELKMILPLQPWYVMPKEVDEMAKLILATCNSISPMRNFMLRGDAGTGKTEAVRALSALLKRPYVEYTCSADTEIFDFYGQSIPDKDGKIVYAETPFISAVKNGYLIEIQEPSVILKEGVLVGLNGLLDQTNRLTLPTGEVVTRHPDCIIVFTTNSTYAGCNDINQSVISRCDAVYDFAIPSRADIVKRVANLVGRSDINDIIGKMVTISSKVRGFLKDNGVSDGTCGIREVVGWVNIYCVTGDILSSALRTIVSKSTSDTTLHADILALVKAAFV